jgi:hypothetical protein
MVKINMYIDYKFDRYQLVSLMAMKKQKNDNKNFLIQSDITEQKHKQTKILIN